VGQYGAGKVAGDEQALANIAGYFAYPRRCRKSGLYIGKPDGRWCRWIHEHHWDRQGV